MTKRRDERVKLQKMQHPALDCGGNKRRRLRGEKERGEMKTFVANLLGLEEVGG